MNVTLKCGCGWSGAPDEATLDAYGVLSCPAERCGSLEFALSHDAEGSAGTLREWYDGPFAAAIMCDAGLRAETAEFLRAANRGRNDFDEALGLAIAHFVNRLIIEEE